jgi:hypothetical protein
MTRRELMARMGSDELMEWLAFDRICPLEDGYWQAAVIASTVANAIGNNKTKLRDFLPRVGKPRDQTPAEMGAIVNGVVAAVEAQKHA